MKAFFENLKTVWSSLWGKLLFLVFILGFVVYGIRDVPSVAGYQVYFYLGTAVAGWVLFKKLSSPISKAPREKPSTTETTGTQGKSLGRAGVSYLETLPVGKREAERSKLIRMSPEKRAEYIRSQREDLAEELFGPPMRAAQPKIERIKGEKLQQKNAETNLWIMPIVVSLAIVAVAMALLYYTVAITIWVLPLAIAIGGGTFILMAIKTWGKEAIMPKLRTGIIILGILGVIWLFMQVSSGKFEGFEFKMPEFQGQGVAEAQEVILTPPPQDIQVETSPGFSPEELANINIGLSQEAEDQLRVVRETNAKATQLIAETFQKLQAQFEADPYNQYHPNYEVLLSGEGNAIGGVQVAEILQKWFNTHSMQNTEQGLVWVEGNPFRDKVKTLESGGFITTAQAGEWLNRGEKEVLLAQIRVQLLQELQQSTWPKAKATLGEFNRSASLLGHTPLPTNMVEVLQEASGGRNRPMPTPIPYQAQVIPVQVELEEAAGTPTPFPTPTLAPTPTGLCSDEAPFKLGDTCMNWPTARAQVVSLFAEVAGATGWHAPDSMAPEITKYLQMAIQQNYALEGPLESAKAMVARAKSGEAMALTNLGFTQQAPRPTPTLPATATEGEIDLPTEVTVQGALGNLQAYYYWVPESWIRNNGSPIKEMRADYRLALSIMLERLSATNTYPYSRERVAQATLYNCVFQHGKDAESCNLPPAWDTMVAQFNGEVK